MVRNAAYVLVSGLLATTASAALAQASPPGPQPETNSNGIADIVVTAQRRSENLQKVAASISAIGGEALRTAGKVQLDDALKTIPSATVDGGPRGFLVRIRGVGLDLPPTVGDPAIAVAKDDIFDDRTETTKAGFYDLDRLEVLRGPQGTLYGRNAIGGAVTRSSASSPRRLLAP